MKLLSLTGLNSTRVKPTHASSCNKYQPAYAYARLLTALIAFAGYYRRFNLLFPYIEDVKTSDECIHFWCFELNGRGPLEI